MKAKELQQRFACGKVEKMYENSRKISFLLRAVFALAGMYCFHSFMVETQAAFRIYPLLGLVFCLVRMYRQGDTVCYVTEKGLVVRSHYRTFYEFMSEIFFGTEHLVFIPYKTIFDIPSNWVTFELGSAEIGGLVVQPVRLRYLSAKNKKEILARIRAAQEEPEDT